MGKGIGFLIATSPLLILSNRLPTPHSYIVLAIGAIIWCSGFYYMAIYKVGKGER